MNARSLLLAWTPPSLLVAILLTACSGGGGRMAPAPGPAPGPGPGTSTGPGPGQGSYSIEEFAPPVRPAGYQPLGSRGFQALSRDELFVVAPTADAEGRIPRLQDDPAAGHAERGDLAPLFVGEGVIHATAFGQLDDDADDEIIVATVDASETRIDLHRVERSAGGGPLQRLYVRSLPAKPWNFEDVRLVLADLDGDFVDEIIVAARSASYGMRTAHCTLWVLDDPAAGAGELLVFDRNERHISLDPLPLDADGDGDLELALGLGGDAIADGRYAVRMYDFDATAGTLVEVHDWIYIQTSSYSIHGFAIAGDFDANGRDDLAYVGVYRRYPAGIGVTLHEFDRAAASWPRYAYGGIANTTGTTPGRLAATAVSSGSSASSLAVAWCGHEQFLPGRTSDVRYARLRYDRAANSWDQESIELDRGAFDRTASLALLPADVDADGIDEVHVAVTAYPASGARLDLGVVDVRQDDSLDLQWQAPIPLGGGGTNDRPRPPILAAGDFDADGLAVEFTGASDLRLADPIPLVVLGAAPTQAGISQNYSSTESAYSTGSTSGDSIGVANYSSITTSVSAGATLFGLLGVEGRAALERGVLRTNTTTRQETVVRGFRGAFDQDVVVFLGTLYETFEYRIVSAPDPTLIGTLMTLDLPVESKTYKWTVDYYNALVNPDDRIGQDLLTHTPGDVASYPTRVELDAQIGTDQHWDMAGSRPVGQGTASDFESVSFETVQASEVERTISRSYGGGASFGISVSVDRTTAEGATHGVFFGETTTFEASVGDIADPDDYRDWSYSWGFAIQTVGRLAGSTEYGPRKHAFQYLRFWVDPQGTAY